MARGPPANIINTGGVLTTVPYAYKEIVEISWKDRRKTPSQYVVLLYGSEHEDRHLFSSHNIISLINKEKSMFRRDT